ncbi:restriction endonuclease subunit S [bacterium]|nr:restriction endonuclease subunit S [bacterium]
MKMEKLSNLILSIESGARPKGGAIDSGIPSIGAEHLSDTGAFKLTNVKYVPESFYNEMKSGKISLNDILIVKDGATTGKVSFVNESFPFKKAAINEHVFILRIKKSMAYSKYVFHFLRTKSGKDEIMKDFRGATVGGISRQFVEQVKIPLPPLEEQIQIATVLSKAENLIAKRKQGIELLDEFVKSTYIEMFIDKGFALEKLGSLSNKITDGEHKKPDYKENGIPFISVTNITKGFLDFNDCKYVSEEDYNKFIKRCNPEEGDILYTKVGATYGRAAIVNTNEKFCLYVSVALIKPKKSIVTPKFLKYSLDHPFIKRQADKSIKGAGVPDLHLVEIKSFDIPVPPLSLQNQFAEIVNKVEVLKVKYQKSLEELENLYASLSQRAFRGEL